MRHGTHVLETARLHALGYRLANSAPTPVERATPNDMLQLTYDRGSVPAQVGAVLLMAGPAAEPDAARRAIAARVAGVPRLRQRLQPVPFGCGRPIWIDDESFDIANHVPALACPAPGDDRALYDVAADLVTTRLDRARPPWRATVVTGLTHGRWAVVVVFHHVLADGIGGLAVLAHLADGFAPRCERRAPVPSPPVWRLALDAAAERLRAIAGLPRTLRRIADGVTQSLPGVTLHAPATSLNQPTGPRRRLAVARVPLHAVRAVAHEHMGTVNDVVLAAVTGALRAVLRRRGEDITTIVVSVPVSGRASAGAELGNQVGVLPVVLPAAGDAHQRLTRIARIMRERKHGQRGASAAVLEPAFRLLATLGAVRWLLDRQRMINTLVTNLRGPAQPMTFLGTPVLDVVMVNGTTGNVSVAFGVLSYAGALNVSVVADPDVCPEHDALTAAVQEQLVMLTDTSSVHDD
ncbi:MAG TPA: wax ester/triacylglycerol synthase family O-acyltransferase [Euzebyales bacterium]|nr:wax ester/triacylglycerol synthase family O-acyltransferase [Euzebyales bacterium]